MIINPKIFSTSTFRLSAIYLAVFALSVAALLAYVYWNTAGLLERQTDETIKAEVQGLADQYRIRGIRGIVDTVQRRAASTGALYLIANPDGERIAGNLQGFPKEAVSDTGWIDFPFDVQRDPGSKRHSARAFHVELEGQYVLVVGRDVQELRAFGDIIRRTMYWALGLALVLGLGGGFLTSRNFLRRVDAITDASRHIMEGDLAGRMPVSGSGDELDRLAQSLNEMLDQIERLMTGMKEVTSNVAHDLKTPLTRLKARVESALRTNNKTDYREALNKTIEESDRLLQTFNALMSIARAEAGQSREGMVSNDFNNIINDLVELYEPMVEEQSGSLTCHSQEGLMVLGDRQLLSQALNNLFDNALKYGLDPISEKPELTITGTIENDTIVVSVADRGTGVAAENRARVVERFIRLDESRSKPGNGLGLSLVASVMKLHGGQLLLEDHDPGLIAKLVLPRLSVKG